MQKAIIAIILAVPAADALEAGLEARGEELRREVALAHLGTHRVGRAWVPRGLERAAHYLTVYTCTRAST